MIYLGYDPGGADGKNGIAILTMNGDAPILSHPLIYTSANVSENAL